MKRIIVVLMALLLCAGLKGAVAGSAYEKFDSNGKRVLMIHRQWIYWDPSKLTFSYKISRSTGEVVVEESVNFGNIPLSGYKGENEELNLEIPQLIPGDYILDYTITGPQPHETVNDHDSASFKVGIFFTDAYLDRSSSKLTITGENFDYIKEFSRIMAHPHVQACQIRKIKVTSWSDTKIEASVGVIKGACKPYPYNNMAPPSVNEVQISLCTGKGRGKIKCEGITKYWTDFIRP